MVHRIFLWLVSHVLHPKNGGFSRIDNVEIHLVYILLNKIQINWENYFVSQMFSIKDCNKLMSLCYISMISKILNYFNIGIPNILYNSPSMAPNTLWPTWGTFVMKTIGCNTSVWARMVGKYIILMTLLSLVIKLLRHMWLMINLLVLLMVFLKVIGLCKM